MIEKANGGINVAAKTIVFQYHKTFEDDTVPFASTRVPVQRDRSIYGFYIEALFCFVECNSNNIV